MPGLLRLRLDNSPEGFFVRDAVAIEELLDLEVDFGRDHIVQLVLPAETVWSRAGLDRLASVEVRARDPRRMHGGVYGAGGLYSHHRWHVEGWPPSDPRAFRELALSDPLNRGAGWVSRDGEVVTVTVGLYKMSSERRARTLEALEELVESHFPARGPGGSRGDEGTGHAGFVSGLPVLVQALDEASTETMAILFPGLLAVSFAVLLLAFRRLRDAALPLALVAVSETVLLGVMGYAGQRLDVVTAILVPLIFVIALATGVHVLSYHRRLQERTPERGAVDDVVATYRVKAWPVLWTGMTTCVGFGSLALAEVPPVRAVGLWATFGIAYLTMAALSFYPALLAMGGAAAAGDSMPLAARFHGLSWSSRLGRRCASLAVARPGIVYGLFGAVAVAALFGLPRLVVETSALTYLDPDHPVRRDIAALENRGLGVVSTSLVLSRPRSNGDLTFDDPDAHRRLVALASTLRNEEPVLGTLSAGELLADVIRHSSGADGSSGDEVWLGARHRVAEVPELHRFLRFLQTPRGDRTRVMLYTAMEDHETLAPLFRRVEERAAEVFPEADVAVTGLYPLVLAAQGSVLDTMVASLAVAFVVIGAVLWLLLRSAGLTLRVLVANAWPVLLVLGVMGWSGVPVDSATMMVAAVALALAVDDTLHTLGHLRSRSATTDRRREVVAVIGDTGPGHVTTSLVLSLGFLVCALSDVVPVSRFGGLVGVGIAGALAADLLLVPALLAGAPTGDVSGLRPRRDD